MNGWLPLAADDIVFAIDGVIASLATYNVGDTQRSLSIILRSVEPLLLGILSFGSFFENTSPENKY